MPEPNFQGIGYDEDDIAGLLGRGGNQVDLSKLGNFIKKGITWGATGALYGVNPALAILAHTRPSFIKLGAKKLGQTAGLLAEDKPWAELTDAEKVAVAQEKFGLAEDFYGATPLSGLVNRFVDIVTGGRLMERDPDDDYRLSP